MGVITPVEVGQFCTVQDSSFAMFGVKKGALVYIAGDSIVSVGADDPYELRRVFVCAYTDEDGGILHEKKPFLMDGKRLKAVSKVKQEKLNQLMQDMYGEKQEDEATH